MQNVAAASIRQANQQTYPFSVCCRSVAMIMKKTTTFDWAAAVSQRQALSKPTAFKLVELMMLVKPPVPFKCMPGFAFHVFDQCYKRKGATRKTHRAAEKVDASGALVDLISMVIINWVTLKVPDTLCGGISPELHATLIVRGPYTRSFLNVLPVLHPDRVQANLYGFMRETGGWIGHVSDRFGFKEVSCHTIASMARALVGRPNIVVVKSPLDFQKPICTPPATLARNLPSNL